MINCIDYKNSNPVVYMIVQPDGKFYIGSSVNLYNRLREHKSYITGKRKQVQYTCKWDELNLFILEEVLNKDQIKDREQYYLNQYWNDFILNKEKRSRGRDINKDKNPMKLEEVRRKVSDKMKTRKGESSTCWRGGAVKIKTTCFCGNKKSYYSITCIKCRNKRVRDELGRFI